MDGYHLSRDQMKALADEEKNRVIGDPASTSGSSTSFEDLLKRRGAPWTFDPSSLIKDFYSAKSTREKSLPVYCRKKSDPVEDGVLLKKTHRVVLVEGNYILAWDDDEWAPLKNLFHDTWFVCCSTMEIQRERLIKRHMETWTEHKTRMFGAAGRDGASIKADSNDVANAYWVDKRSRKHANLIVDSI
jgi:pantothenate kinase